MQLKGHLRAQRVAQRVVHRRRIRSMSLSNQGEVLRRRNRDNQTSNSVHCLLIELQCC